MRKTDLQFQCAIARSSGNARLDAVALAVFLTGTKVDHMPCRQRDNARLADTHPAAERHLNADVLTGFEQAGRAVDGGLLVRFGEGDGATCTGGVGARDLEPLQVKPVLDRSSGREVSRAIRSCN